MWGKSADNPGCCCYQTLVSYVGNRPLYHHWATIMINHCWEYWHHLEVMPIVMNGKVKSCAGVVSKATLFLQWFCTPSHVRNATVAVVFMSLSLWCNTCIGVFTPEHMARPAWAQEQDTSLLAGRWLLSPTPSSPPREHDPALAHHQGGIVLPPATLVKLSSQLGCMAWVQRPRKGAHSS